MSILIKGMEMPEEGNWRSVRIYPDGTIGRPIGFGDYALVEGVQAVPVPPHGRLIDGDIAEVITYASEDEGGDFADGILYAADFISKQTTIIPAEEGET